MSNSKQRWKLAQTYEKDWWAAKAPELDLEFYERFAKEIEQILSPFVKINDETTILEIGSGAAGIITYLNSNKKFAIDPLEDFFSSVEKFASIRDKRVVYKKAMAEEISFKNAFFDLIVIDNVLDHCSDPKKVLSEMQRTLKNGGIIYFRQNTYHVWGKFIRNLIEAFKIDQGHPHTFLKSELRNMFVENKMTILFYEGSGYYKTWMKEIKSKRIYDKIKAIIFATRDKTTFILQKTD
jgi:SAM-dependent methyltransferase